MMRQVKIFPSLGLGYFHMEGEPIERKVIMRQVEIFSLLGLAYFHITFGEVLLRQSGEGMNQR